jgi:hypothetical protein
MQRDSVLAILPGTRPGTSEDCFDLEVSGPNGNICLGFDSTDRLDFLSHSYSPYPTDTQISTDPLIAKIGRKTDSLEELDRVENHVFISSFTHYEDSIKDFTFAGTVRGWKAYWWKEPGYQLFVAVRGDTMIVNTQSVTSLINAKRKNIPLVVPGDSTRVYLPFWR